jgi:Transposase IS66 family
MLRTLLMVVASLQEKKITLQRLRDLFFGWRSEKRKKSSEAEEKDEERIECHCLVHARRKFWEIAENYPVQCGYVLMRIREIYQNQEVTKDKGMSDDERLAYHQRHSGPQMEELREWMERELGEKGVEPNSSLGKAISYIAKTIGSCVPFSITRELRWTIIRPSGR